MESRLIHIVCRYALGSYEWPQIGQEKDSSEYVFIGMGTEFKRKLVEEMIEVFLIDPTVYLLKGRHDSKEIPTNDLLQIIIDNDGSLTLMKKDRSVAVEFRGDICRVGFRK